MTTVRPLSGGAGRCLPIPACGSAAETAAWKSRDNSFRSSISISSRHCGPLQHARLPPSIGGGQQKEQSKSARVLSVTPKSTTEHKAMSEHLKQVRCPAGIDDVDLHIAQNQLARCGVDAVIDHD